MAKKKTKWVAFITYKKPLPAKVLWSSPIDKQRAYALWLFGIAPKKKKKFKA